MSRTRPQWNVGQLKGWSKLTEEGLEPSQRRMASGGRCRHSVAGRALAKSSTALTGIPVLFRSNCDLPARLMAPEDACRRDPPQGTRVRPPTWPSLKQYTFSTVVLFLFISHIFRVFYFSYLTVLSSLFNFLSFTLLFLFLYLFNSSIFLIPLCYWFPFFYFPIVL